MVDIQGRELGFREERVVEERAVRVHRSGQPRARSWDVEVEVEASWISTRPQDWAEAAREILRERGAWRA